MPTSGDEATEADAPSELVTPAIAEPTTDAASKDDDEPFPPALIVRQRATDRAVSRTIGAPTPAHVGPGASVTFGLSVSGRSAERVAVGGATRARERGSVPPQPHPRIDPLPTRVATVISFGSEDPEGC